MVFLNGCQRILESSFRQSVECPNPIFVIGCARSGTNWLGRLLGQSPDVVATIEDPLSFSLVDRMALYPATTPQLFPLLSGLYKRRTNNAWPMSYLDKSHQNIWLVERLWKAFPECVFLAIEREPYAAVASMAAHDGVRAHFARWHACPRPSRHIGVTSTLMPVFGSLSIVEKCAWRWLSHHQRLNELQERSSARIVRVGYEDMILQTDDRCKTLATILGVSIPQPCPRTVCLGKWRSCLSVNECTQIQAITGCRPPVGMSVEPNTAVIDLQYREYS